MRYLIGRTTIRIVLSSLFVSLGVNLTGDTTPLHRAPSPMLAIDCGFGQPCTGTACITNTTTHYCDGDPSLAVECEADSQQYSGGDQICCTDRSICDFCVYRGKSVTYYNYTGSNGSCTPNH